MKSLDGSTGIQAGEKKTRNFREPSILGLLDTFSS